MVIPADQRDQTLEIRLEKELPGILKWAVDGCLEWQKVGLQPPQAVRGAVDEYRLESDLVGQFDADRIQSESGASISVKDLYEAFTDWCHANGEQPISKRAFNPGLKRRGFLIRRGAKGVHLWKGIRLKEWSDDLEATLENAA